MKATTKPPTMQQIADALIRATEAWDVVMFGAWFAACCGVLVDAEKLARWFLRLRPLTELS